MKLGLLHDSRLHDVRLLLTSFMAVAPARCLTRARLTDDSGAVHVVDATGSLLLLGLSIRHMTLPPARDLAGYGIWVTSTLGWGSLPHRADNIAGKHNRTGIAQAEHDSRDAAQEYLGRARKLQDKAVL
ncbi:hypothetical protein JB92DRAFT_674639 [Gautieria morchelliformis]|nr:hypothetical protein JB92DRAFT_674639 [Gautieria morchelliformis]